MPNIDLSIKRPSLTKESLSKNTLTRRSEMSNIIQSRGSEYYDNDEDESGSAQINFSGILGSKLSKAVQRATISSNLFAKTLISLFIDVLEQIRLQIIYVKSYKHERVLNIDADLSDTFGELKELILKKVFIHLKYCKIS